MSGPGLELKDIRPLATAGIKSRILCNYIYIYICALRPDLHWPRRTHYPGSLRTCSLVRSSVGRASIGSGRMLRFMYWWREVLASMDITTCWLCKHSLPPQYTDCVTCLPYRHHIMRSTYHHYLSGDVQTYPRWFVLWTELFLLAYTL